MENILWRFRINIFRENARISFLGSSGSGKTSLFSRLVQKYARLFDEVIAIGGDLVTIENVSNFRRDDEYNFLESDKNIRSLILIDDSLFDKKLIRLTAEAFTKIRHQNCSICFCSQSIYFNSSEYRNILHNSSHIFLLRNRNIDSIRQFSKSFLARDQIDNFVNVYKKIVLKNKYGYLLLDFTKDFESPLLIRTNVVNEINSYEMAFSV